MKITFLFQQFIFISLVFLTSIPTLNSTDIIENLQGETTQYFRSLFHDLKKESLDQFGLFTYQNEAWVKDIQVAHNSKTILLVHGLDDPGFLWNQLTEVLIKKGFHVIRLNYPNDQAITKSTKYLAEQLVLLKEQGIHKLKVIAHSMGGIIARDVLTHSDYYHNFKDGFESGPIIQHLITVGTPNNGSHFANFRLLSELGEQFLHLINGEANFLGFLYDGYGQAGKDLLPESTYLKELNNRPNLTIPTTIIAGKIGKLHSQNLSQTLKDWLDPSLKVDQLLTETSNLMGDGVVTIESAKLKNITDFHIVDGNHISILTNFNSSQQSPSSFPIILKTLETH